MFQQLEEAQPQLALSIDTAMNLMENMRIITPAIFDYFVMVILTWYTEESNSEDGSPPNLYYVFAGGGQYSEMFYRIFIDAYAQRYAKEHNIPIPNPLELTDQEMHDYGAMFMERLDRLYSLMVEDFEKVLDSMHVTYVWDSTGEGGEDMQVKNNPIIEVW